MEKVESLNVPIGWLIDPHNKWAIHFDCKDFSKEHDDSTLTIDMWGIVSSGKPMEFKSRRKATKQEARKSWNQLIEADWVEFDFANIKTA